MPRCATTAHRELSWVWLRNQGVIWREQLPPFNEGHRLIPMLSQAETTGRARWRSFLAIRSSDAANERTSEPHYRVLHVRTTHRIDNRKSRARRRIKTAISVTPKPEHVVPSFFLNHELRSTVYTPHGLSLPINARESFAMNFHGRRTVLPAGSVAAIEDVGERSLNIKFFQNDSAASDAFFLQ